MGPGVAAGFLQRALNALNRGASDYADILVDRSIGPLTLGALQDFLARRGLREEEVLLKAVEALQGQRYLSWPSSGPPTKPSSPAGLLTA